jgi:hypothetical protein
MSGSNGRGMSGSNGRGMSGSNGRGMSGSNGRGMSGSNGRGMSGSNGRGMSGSNGRGMSGSNGRGMSGSNVRGAAVEVGEFGLGFVSAAMGAVDAIAVDGHSAALTIAGQTFSVAAEDASGISVGDYVVAGAIEADAAALVYHVGLPYVPGVSQVRVKGALSSLDAATGKLTIGALVVDYTPYLAEAPNFAAEIGDVVALAGVQPSIDGVLLVESAQAVVAGNALSEAAHSRQ